MKISIRKAIKNDLPEIIRIYTQPEMDNSHVISLQQAKLIFKKMQSYPDYHLYVAITSENQIVGTFSLLIIDNLVHNGGISAIIEAVAVDPAHQGQRIGKPMMQFAMKECRSKHCGKLVLSSNLKRKNAHQFYESLGFC
jgi:ribosomal protein S18 acetylase RimI-like enzyme